jgi:hypothetical protein
MAVPTITGIDPASGPAAGLSLVRITGTNFRVYDAPAYGDLREADPTTVQVLFDTNASVAVRVESETEIVVLVPAYTGTYFLHEFTAVDITVRNLDDDGDPIAGEEVVSSSAYTYKREPLRPPTLPVESPFKRVSEGIITLLGRQVLLNSGLNTHTDYSPDGVIIREAGVPSLSLIGPDTSRDAYGAENASYWETQEDTSALRWPPPEMTTFSYDLIGQTDNDGEFLTLMGAARQFFRSNPYYVMTADVPEVQARFPMMVVGEPVRTGEVPLANLHEFTLTFEVRRIPILYMPPISQTWPIEELELQVQKIGGILVETSAVW